VQTPPSPEPYRFPADIPGRSKTLRTFIDLPVTADHPALVRYAPFGDRREIVLRRGPERLTFQQPAFETGRRIVRVGEHEVVVVAIQQVLSPPVPPTGVPMRSQAELEYHYKPVIEAMFLPDGELLVTRTPNGFTDTEVAQLFSRIRITDANTPPPAGASRPLTPPRGESPTSPKPTPKTSTRARIGGVVQIGVGLGVWALTAVLAGASGVYSGRLVFLGVALVSIGLLTVAVPSWIRWIRPPTPPARQLMVALLIVGVLLVEQRFIEAWLGFNGP
jgi:hypothetical protein